MLSKASACVCPYVWEFTPTCALMSVCWYWMLCESCKPPPACSLSHLHTYTERVHYIWLPPLRELREDLSVCGKDQEKCFLINYSPSHNPFLAECCIALCDALHLQVSVSVSLSLSLCCPPPSLSHSFNVPFFSRRLRFLISLPALFCMLQRWASRPQRRARFLGKLSLIMAAINNMS